MPTLIEFANLDLVDATGNVWGVVEVRPVQSGGKFKLAPLAEATAEEMRDWAEERVQLLENRRYEYKLSAHSNLRLRLVEGVITRSEFNKLSGSIEPGSNVGLLTLEAEDEDGQVVAKAAIEVRSTKLGYRKQYRRMLEDITDYCADLLLQVRAPAQGLFQPDFNERPETIAQRYSFLKYLLTTNEFRDAIARILGDPHTKSVVEESRREIGRGFKPDKHTLRQLASGTPRQNVPPSHPLAKRMTTVPTHIMVRKQADTLDTAENRFIRYALESFDALLADMESVLLGKSGNSPSSRRLLNDIEGQRRNLSGILGSSLFREVSAPTLLDFGSPVLQRRAGYREILRSWLRFTAAARLVWEGGLDVYGGGKRDVANLYEYWVFFQLLDAVTQAFDLPKPDSDSLIEPTGDGFGLKLKAGKQLVINSRSLVRGRELCIRFAYNRTFSGKKGELSYPDSGSWTRIMRPDYTLSIWPAELSEVQAENYELMTHIHFDAKYKLDQGSGTSDSAAVFGTNEEKTLNDEKQAARAGRVSKRADLLTLHAYRDAIRRTEGAYVIYPGDVSRKWSSFHELLPGLGAFAIKPDDAGEGLSVLNRFLQDVSEQVSNRAATRERARYFIHTSNTPFVPQDLSADFSELTPTGERALPPINHLVLDCTVRNLAHSNWLQTTSKFDIPLSGVITQELVGVKHLLVRGLSPTTAYTFYRVELTEIIGGADLLIAGHPDAINGGTYLVFTIAPAVEFDESILTKIVGPAPGSFVVENLVSLLSS